MADRSVKVRLDADVNDFTREMGRATKSIDELAKAAGQTEGAAKTSMGRMVQSARLQRDEWTKVGTSLLTVGTVWTGLNVLVAKTGIEYNGLQQKSRAALRVLVGGAQEANAQMDKLDAFARTSPFSKAVFIQAQQQMLGFGIEAKKIIPYLSAINEAVAATGGSNQDIAELTRIFSQVQAAAKITSVDLMQFGQRGVDAATLIGSQMGKTGAEIRAEITNGTLDAGVALDALADGMQERFGGASAAVKDTLGGALDRVTAAWRDLSSSMMEGAVGREGGGWLVGLTNSLADVIRWVERLPAPLKDALGVLSALGGTATLAAGGFITLVPRLAETYTAVRTLATAFPTLALAAGPVAAAVGLVAVALGAMIGDMAKYRAEVEDYAAAMKLAGDAGTEAERKLSAQALAAGKVVEALDGLGVAASLAVDATMGDAEARGKIVAAYDAQIAKLRDLEDAAAREGQGVGNYLIEADMMISERDRIVGLIDREAGKRGQAIDLIDKENALLGDSTTATADAADGHEKLTAGLGATAEMSAEVAKEYEKWIGVLADSSASFVEILGAYDAVIAKNKEVAEATATSTESSKDSWQDYYDGFSVSLDDYLTELERQVAAQQEWQTNMTILAGKVSKTTLDELAKLGPEGAALVQDLTTASEDELARTEAAFAAGGQASGQAYAANYEATYPIMQAVAQKMGKGAVDTVAAEIASGKYTLQQIIDKYNLQATIDGDTTLVIRAAEEARSRINSMRATITITSSDRTAAGGFTVTPMRAAGGFIGGYAAGGSPRWTRPGYVSGPGTSTSDSVPAWLSRDEFVTRASSAQYYGPTVMHAINEAAVPREWFSAIGLASGGSPRGQVYSSPSTPSLGALTLDSSGLAPVIEAGLRRGLAGARFYLDGREIAVRLGIDDLALRAHAAGRGI